jgi:superfamily II DNA/RNA helicase
MSIITTNNETVATFSGLGVPSELVDVLTRSAITTPSPVQAMTLPDTLGGRDVIGQGRTGSGKTLAFALPLIARLAGASGRRQAGAVRALVLVPTRELARQVAATIQPLADATGLRCIAVFGGVPINRQANALRDGADVVVACPGRLEDLIRQGRCRLDRVEMTVLDEADHMSDLGFVPAVRRILDATPSTGQRLLFSATVDATVDALVKRYLRDPALHRVAPSNDQVSQAVHELLLIDEADRLPVLRDLVGSGGQTLLFTRTKHRARRIARQLNTMGFKAVELHGDLSQPARERNLLAFATGGAQILVATDIAARGLHIDELPTVVHFDPPAEHKAYLHRSGRTGRAGRAGRVLTLMTDEQRRNVQSMINTGGLTATTTRVHPGHPYLRAGAVTATPPAPAARQHVGPQPDPARPARRRPRPGRRSRS